MSREEQQPEHRALRNLKPSIRLALYAGLTSLFMTLLYQAGDAFYALPLHDKVEQAETILIATVLSLFVLDPFLHSIRALIQTAPTERGAQHRELDASHVRLFITLVIVFVAICDGLLHEYLGHNVSPKGLVGVVQLVSSLAAPSIVTFAWLRGLARTPPRAGMYGLIAGAVVGIFFFALDLAFIVRYELPKIGITPHTILSSLSAVAAVAIFAFGFLWPILTSYFPPGLLGGLVAERAWCSRAWQRMLVGLGIAALVQSLSSLAVFYLFYRAMQPIKSTGISLGIWMLPPLFGNAGWALAFYLDIDADNLLRAVNAEHARGVKTEAYNFLRTTALLFLSATALGITCMLTSALIVRRTASQPSPFSRPLPPPTAKAT